MCAGNHDPDREYARRMVADEDEAIRDEERDRRERVTPGEGALSFAGPETVSEMAQRRREAVGAVLARRLPGVEYMAPEMLREIVDDLIGAMDAEF